MTPSVLSAADSIPHEVPQVLINREPLPHLNFDVELLGDCDGIVNELCHRLGGDFEPLCFNSLRLAEITEKPPRLPERPPNETSSDAEPNARPTDTADQPSEEAESPQDTDAAQRNATPPEPRPEKEAAESPERPVEDTPTEEADAFKSQVSTLEVRKRCWMSRINRSPISKRLEGEPDASTRKTLPSWTPSLLKQTSFLSTSRCRPNGPSAVLHSGPVPLSSTEPVHFPRSRGLLRL